jgi:hypothetical protein
MNTLNKHEINKQGIRIQYMYGMQDSYTITQHYWPGTKKVKFSDLQPL